MSYKTKLYQILDNTKAKSLEIQEWLDGSLHLNHEGQKLKFKPINQRPVKEETEKTLPKPRLATKPAADHPWREYANKGRLCQNSLHLNALRNTFKPKDNTDAGPFSPLPTVFTKRKKEAKKEKELLLVH